MKNHWFRRFVPLFLLLLVFATVAQPFTEVSADTIISQELIYPEDPVLVDGLDFGIPETDVYWEFPVSDEYGDVENFRFYFYSFADLDLCEPEFGQMVDYFRRGYYLGFSEPLPAVSVVGEEGNQATLWYLYEDNYQAPIMMIGEAGSYTLPACDSTIFSYDSITLEFPVDGIAVISAYVGWHGYVGVYDDIQNSVEGGKTDMGIVESITEICTAVASFVVSTLSGLVPMFYSAETGLTFLGVLAVAGLAFSVGFLVIVLISGFLKFRR